MASAKSVLEKMITAMYRGGDSSKRALLEARTLRCSQSRNMRAEETPYSLASKCKLENGEEARKKLAKKKKAKR